MTDFVSTDFQRVEFTLSPKSQVAKARWWLWIGMATGLAVTLLTGGVSKASIASVLVVIVLTAILDLSFFRSQSKPGQFVFSLSADGLESSRFTTKAKKFAWVEVQSVAIEATQALQAVSLPPGDPRAALARDSTRLAELLLEGLAMESNIVDGKPVPADLVRTAQIQAELQLLNVSIPKQVEQLKVAQKR